MRKVVAASMGLLILMAANLCAGGDYVVTVKLQEYSRPDGTAIDIKEVASDPAGLARLTAGEIRFLHRAKLPADGTTEEEMKIGKTEAKIRYKMSKEKNGKISVVVWVELAETTAVKEGVPFQSTRSVNTTIDCPIGQEIPLGGVASGGNNGISLFTVRVTR